jgi:DNA repair protein RecO (recombination protein O)
MCGFYLNELLLNLMARDDPHESLFDYYQQTLLRLAQEEDHAFTLRCFEKHMLQELGYALLLETEADSGKPIVPTQTYRYILERGAIAETPDAAQGMPVMGKTLLDMAADDYSDTNSARQSKLLMRMLLDHHLAGKTLHTRELMRDLQKL